MPPNGHPHAFEKAKRVALHKLCELRPKESQAADVAPKLPFVALTCGFGFKVIFCVFRSHERRQDKFYGKHHLSIMDAFLT